MNSRPDPLAGLSSTRKGQYGLFLASAEATLHGHKVRVEHEQRRTRLRVNDLLTEVWTTLIDNPNSDGWVRVDVRKPVEADTAMVILADRAQHEKWDYYIATAEWVRAFTAEGHESFLDDQKDKTGERERPDNRDSKSTTIRLSEPVTALRGRWDLFSMTREERVEATA